MRKQTRTFWEKFWVGVNVLYIALSATAIIVLGLIVGNVIKVGKGENYPNQNPNPETYTISQVI